MLKIIKYFFNKQSYLEDLVHNLSKNNQDRKIFDSVFEVEFFITNRDFLKEFNSSNSLKKKIYLTYSNLLEKSKKSEKNPLLVIHSKKKQYLLINDTIADALSMYFNQEYDSEIVLFFDNMKKSLYLYKYKDIKILDYETFYAMLSEDRYS